MKRIGDIDAFGLSRSKLSEEQRTKQAELKAQERKEAGYRQLFELCCLGEHDFAKQLANQNSHWGYEIVDGEVVEKEEF